MTPSNPGGRQINSDDFWRIEAVFASAIGLDPEGRARVVGGACAERPDLRHEIEALLVAHDRLAAAGGSPDDENDISGLGLQVGAYRLVEKIGEGGMGEVFRAERTDGLFAQQVAVKLTRSTIADSDLRRRFLVERQILASLNHDNIVRLLDGGTTSRGQAFLIMEHVEGVPLAQHCRDHSLSLEERLQLLCAVCRAVQYAHQHGVVHRDLKPANILVTSDHIPKVVDFGVAKLLEGHAGSGFTTTGVVPGPLTPNYASPEQIRGLPVTTASDVYALGVVLYEIVAGVRPYETQGLPLERVIEVVLHEQPGRPSASPPDEARPLPYGKARLRGDIDALVLKAMSKDPAERYASASELAGDITRWLKGEPVLARTPSAGYILRRMALRHKRLATVSALALVSVLSASGVAVWQWRVARNEQARAEQRFSEVRQLANAVIFKIHDAVLPLPGSTPVRRLIVDEAIGYLERLDAEPGDDPTLRLELADAHRQVGAILGNASIANLGDRDGARKQYQRAHEILRPLLTNTASFEVVRSVVDADLRLSGIALTKGEQDQAIAFAREAVTHTSAYRDYKADDARGADLQARAYFALASALPRSEAMAIWYQTLDYYEKLLVIQPDDAPTQRNVALVGKYIGGNLESTDAKAARKHYARALELDEKRLTASPDDPRVQFDAAISYSNMASVSELLGDIDAAGRLFERSLALRRQLVQTDPTNVQARGRLGYLLTRLGRFHLVRDPSAALAFSREGVGVLEPSFVTTKDISTRVTLARAWNQIGRGEMSLKADAKACEAFRRSNALYSQGGTNDASEDYEAKYSAERAAACSAAR